MKCPNCGTEMNGILCVMCGTKIEQQSFNSENSQNNFYNNAGSFNSMPVNTPIQQPVSPPVQNIPSQPYNAPSPQSPVPQPIQGNTNIPPQQGTTPTQNPYPVPQQNKPNNPVKKSSGKKLFAIIFVLIIIAVILAGVGIAIYSAFFYDSSIFENLIDMTSSILIS